MSQAEVAEPMVEPLVEPARVPASAAAPHNLFTTSILVSAARCLLTYVLLPFVAPAVGLATGVGPAVGIPLSLVAIGANVASIRRFFLARHRWRWVFAAVSSSVIVLLMILLVLDVATLAG